MSYSRRQLEAFGETLGESVTRKEGGRTIYGGGGSSAPAQTTQTSDLPDWAKPYAQDVLAKGSALTTGAQYQPYTGERTAQFTPLQQQSYNTAGGMQTAPQFGTATGLAAQAGQQALNAGAGFDPYQSSMLYAQAPGGVQQVGTQSFTQPGAAGSYMSPYMQEVVGIQQRDASRASDIMRNQQQAQAVQQGAFGGSRSAIVEAERQKNLATQLGDIQATGSQAAYQQAMQQFNAEQQARLAAQQSNQQAGLTLGQQGLQAQMANQQAYQNAQQLAEQSRQYGAGLGLQGLQTALSGANTLGTLGGQQFQQGMDITQLQNQYGAQQQSQVQNMLTQQYQDYLNQMKYPYQQLDYMSNLIRGTPTGMTSSLYAAQPSTATQLAGMGTALYGANQLMKAEGGTVESEPGAGLGDLALSKI